MDFEIVVEIQRGSRNKYEINHDTGEIWLDRRLFTAMTYPADYGYIAGTLGEDGDPLDVLVLLGADEIEVAPGAFVVYIGSHGDRGAHRQSDGQADGQGEQTEAHGRFQSHGDGVGEATKSCPGPS